MSKRKDFGTKSINGWQTATRGYSVRSRRAPLRIFRGRDGNGKRRYINKTIRGKKKDAQDYLNKTLSAISSGTFVEPSPMTVIAYFDKWLAATRGRVREKTFRSYEDVLRLYVRPAIGEKRLMDVRPLDLQNLYSHMQAAKLKDKDAAQPPQHSVARLSLARSEGT